VVAETAAKLAAGACAGFSGRKTRVSCALVGCADLSSAASISWTFCITCSEVKPGGGPCPCPPPAEETPIFELCSWAKEVNPVCALFERTETGGGFDDDFSAIEAVVAPDERGRGGGIGPFSNNVEAAGVDRSNSSTCAEVQDPIITPDPSQEVFLGEANSSPSDPNEPK